MTTSSRAKSNRRYRALCRLSDGAFKRNDYRLAADKNFEAFEAAPSKWTDGRTSCLENWLACLAAIEMTPAALDFKDDDARLKRISYDESEPLHTRVLALFGRSAIQHNCFNVTKEATYLRRGIALAGEVEEDERARIIKTSKGSQSVREVIDHWMIKAKSCLRDIENPSSFPCDIDACVDRIGHCSEIERNRLMRAMLHCFSTGGDKCDGCEKTPADLGMDALFKCSRCKLGFYCSKACQCRRWEGGHAKFCCEYGQISADDVMFIHSLKNRRDLNGKFVRVERPDKRKEGRWEVLNLETHGMLSVESQNLRHARPPV